MKFQFPPMHIIVCMLLFSSISLLANSDFANLDEDYCTIPITNNSCGDIELYDDILTPLAWIKTIPRGATYNHISRHGSKLTFKYADHTLVSEWYVVCGESYAVVDQCGGSGGGPGGGGVGNGGFTCSVSISNSACEDIRIFTYTNGSWIFISQIAQGNSKTLDSTSGANLTARYADGTTISSWQAVCGSNYNVNVDCPTPPQTCTINITNSACEEIGIYKQSNGGYLLVNTIAVNQTEQQSITNGTTYKATYADGTTVDTWQAWCSESVTIDDNCAPATCNITITNNACEVLKVYESNGSGWPLAITIPQGATVTYATSNGTNFIAQYADGTTVSSWQAWCGEVITVNDTCTDPTCSMKVMNNTCAPIYLNEYQSSGWTVVKVIAAGDVYHHPMQNGDYFKALYADGTTVSSWQGWCDEVVNLTDSNCSNGCTMQVTNNACDVIKFFEYVNGDWQLVSTISVNQTYTHPLSNGDVFIAKYTDGTTVHYWQGWCDEDVTVNDDDCNNSCTMEVTNDACEAIIIMEYSNGNWSSQQTIATGSSAWFNITNGAYFKAVYTDGTTVETWQAWCGEDVIVTDDCASNCTMKITNSACETIYVMQYYGGNWSQAGQISVGQMLTFNITNGDYFKAIYADGTTVDTWQSWCNENFTISDECASSCRMKITNDACETIYVMQFYNGNWSQSGQVGVGAMVWFDISNGDYFKAIYADGTTVDTWQSWCNENFTISDECASSCTIRVTNNACETVKLYEQHYGNWVQIAVLGENQSCTHETTNGATWKAEYANGTNVRSWQAWCNENITLTDDCAPACPITITNKACESVKLLEYRNSNWSEVAVIAVNESCTHATTNGASWKAVYSNGTTVQSWQAWCNENVIVQDDCAPACPITITNNACESVKLLEYRSSSWAQVAVIAVDESCTHATTNGASWKAVYTDGTTVQSWQAWCNENVIVQDDCEEEYCSVYIQNSACDDLTLYKKNSSGSYALVGTIRVGETFWQNSSNGAQYQARYSDGTVVDSWTIWCGETFVVADTDCDDPVEECDVYFKNETCYPIKVSVNNGGSYTLIATIDVGATIDYTTTDGTEFKFQYEDGSIITTWDSKCNQVFKVQGECDTDQCESVSITSIQLVGGSSPVTLTEGQEIASESLGDSYYIECVASDQTESVTIYVNDIEICENYLPFTYPAHAEDGSAWNAGPGTYRIKVVAHSESNCNNICDQEEVTITILEPDTGGGGDDCALEVNTKRTLMMCDGTVQLSAYVNGASDCGGGGTNIPEDVCTDVVDFAGYIADPSYGSGCADNNGMALSASIADAQTYSTFDLGGTYPAGVEICATMRLRHCLDTEQSIASASILSSMEMRDDYQMIESIDFTNESYQQYCFTLNADTKYIRIEDNMACSFRIDAVVIPQTAAESPENTGNDDVTFTWYNADGEVVDTGAEIYVDELGSYYVIATDCNGCTSQSQLLEVTTLFDETCDVDGGVIALGDGGGTAIDYCIGETIDLDIDLYDVNGDNTAWIIVNADNTILMVAAEQPSTFSSDEAGVCYLYHLSYYNTLSNLEVGNNLSDLSGVYDLSNEITITRYAYGDGPCSSSAKDGDTNPREAIGKGLSITAYPNPTVDYLYIELDDSDPMDWSYEIYAIDGRRLDNNNLASDSKLDVTTLDNSQFYILKLTSEEYGQRVLKFFKQ